MIQQLFSQPWARFDPWIPWHGMTDDRLVSTEPTLLHEKVPGIDFAKE
jgi:hypothetical protein